MAIAAAEMLLVKEGLPGVSMRKVAATIGYTVGNLYLLFRNQDDLLATVNERTGDALHAQLEAAISKVTDPRARLRALARAYVDYALRHPSRFRLMYEHRLPDDMRPRPSADDRITRLYRLAGLCLQPWLDAADADAQRLATTALWSAVHGVGTLAVSGKLGWGGNIDAGSLSDVLIDTFVDGVEARR